MRKIASDLKRMFAALSYESIGVENMSLRSKKSFLESGHVPTHTPVHSSVHSTVKAAELKVNHPQTAVIFDGHASDQVMNYLLHTPYIFNTDIIILAHGKDPQLEQKVQSLSKHLTQAGRDHTVSYLLEDMADAFQEFCNDHPSLQFLVAPKDDQFALEVINNPEFHSHSHEIPLILIQDNERKT